MDLATLVTKYLEVAGEFERPIHVSRLGLSKAEAEHFLSALDEDYQISRYMVLSRQPDDVLAEFPPHSRIYLVNGFECSHLSLRAEIQKILK